MSTTKAHQESPTNNDSVAGPGNDEIAAKAVTSGVVRMFIPGRTPVKAMHEGLVGKEASNKGNERLLTTVDKREQEPVRGLPAVDRIEGVLPLASEGIIR